MAEPTMFERIERECDFGETLGLSRDDAREIVKQAHIRQRGNGLPDDWAAIHQALIDHVARG